MLTKYMIIMSMVSVMWWRKSMIAILLSLEIMLISIFTLMSLFSMNFSSMNMLIMLTLMVSSSALGLSMLVSSSRNHKSSISSPIWMLTFDKIYYSIFNFYV